jgi:hypothetical protein
MRPLSDLAAILGWRARSVGEARLAPAGQGACGSCRHFRNDAAYLEAAIPGLASLSSASASVRADDGLCLLRDRYLSARASCARFAAARAANRAPASILR